MILPKLYRRLANWSIANRHTTQKLPTFKVFVGAGKGNEFHRFDGFVAQGPTAAVVEHLGAYLVSGKLDVEPEDIVFREEPSSLVDSAIALTRGGRRHDQAA